MDAKLITLGLLLIAVVLAFYFVFKPRKKWLRLETKFPDAWKSILEGKVSFYTKLSTSQKTLFEFKIQEFLLNLSLLMV